MPIPRQPSDTWFAQPQVLPADHPDLTADRALLADWQHDWGHLEDALGHLPARLIGGYDTTPADLVLSAVGPAWDVYGWTVETGTGVDLDWVGTYVAWRSVNGWHALVLPDNPLAHPDDFDPQNWANTCGWAARSAILATAYLNLFGPAPDLATLLTQVLDDPHLRTVTDYTQGRNELAGLLHGLRALAGTVGETIPAATAAATQQMIRKAPTVAAGRALLEPGKYLPGYSPTAPAIDARATAFLAHPAAEVPVADLADLAISSTSPLTHIPTGRVPGARTAGPTEPVTVPVAHVSKAEVAAALETLRLGRPLDGGTIVGDTVIDGIARLVACRLVGETFPCTLLDDDPGQPRPGVLYNF